MRISLLTLLCSLNAFAQYNAVAGHNAPAAAKMDVERVDKSGKKYVETVVQEAPRDNYGNAQGTGRYVMNAAAWLANYERFGDAVVAGEFKKK